VALRPRQKNRWAEWQGTSGAGSDPKPRGCVCQRIAGHRASKPGGAAHPPQKEEKHVQSLLSPLFVAEPRFAVSERKSGLPERLVAQHSC